MLRHSNATLIASKSCLLNVEVVVSVEDDDCVRIRDSFAFGILLKDAETGKKVPN
jgi:hypothetical protein